MIREMHLFLEEIFGAIVPIARYSSEEEAVEITNDTPDDVISYDFTYDLDPMRHDSNGLDHEGGKQAWMSSGEQVHPTGRSAEHLPPVARFKTAPLA